VEKGKEMKAEMKGRGNGGRREERQGGEERGVGKMPNGRIPFHNTSYFSV